MKGLNNLIQLVGMGLLLAAVYRELRKPPQERAWRGAIAEFIPYDLRVPTLSRAKARVWNPEDDRVLVPTIFGVGWTVNLARVVDMLKRSYQQDRELDVQ